MQTHPRSVLDTEPPSLCSVLDTERRKAKTPPTKQHSASSAEHKTQNPQKTLQKPPALNIMLRPPKHYADVATHFGAAYRLGRDKAATPAAPEQI